MAFHIRSKNIHQIFYIWEIFSAFLSVKIQISAQENAN